MNQQIHVNAHSHTCTLPFVPHSISVRNGLKSLPVNLRIHVVADESAGHLRHLQHANRKLDPGCRFHCVKSSFHVVRQSNPGSYRVQVGVQLHEPSAVKPKNPKAVGAKSRAVSWHAVNPRHDCDSPRVPLLQNLAHLRGSRARP